MKRMRIRLAKKIKDHPRRYSLGQLQTAYKRLGWRIVGSGQWAMKFANDEISTPSTATLDTLADICCSFFSRESLAAR